MAPTASRCSHIPKPDEVRPPNHGRDTRSIKRARKFLTPHPAWLVPKSPGCHYHRSQLGLRPRPSASPHGGALAHLSAGPIPSPLASCKDISRSVLKTSHTICSTTQASCPTSSHTMLDLSPKIGRRETTMEGDTYHIHLRHALSSLSRGRTRIHSG